MVGIILASHGSFAEGILQSVTMVFGEQPNVAAVTLMPDESPDDIRKKMENAIASFDNPEQILFLADLFGGTPYNQANRLINGHEDTWAVVTGLNLPMLISAYSERMMNEAVTAHEIASAIYEPAKEGMRITPDSLEKKASYSNAADTSLKTENTSAAGLKEIPKGTVLGDGHIKFVLARIDSRLLHGQVATSWTKTVQPNRIIVVSDDVAHDELRKKLIISAAPPGVHAHVVPINKMIQVAKDPRFGATKAMLLFETPQDALRLIEGGVDIKELNVGSMAHSVGKAAVNKVLSLGKEDVDTFEKLIAKGISLDIRKVPSDSKEDINAIIAKAKAELIT